MKRNRNDMIAKIVTARDEARVKKNAYRNLTSKRYDYWRAIATIAAYQKTLAMFEQGTEHKIPDMASGAVADFERLRVRNGGTPIPEMNLVIAEGRRDALASVADWMTDEESNRSKKISIHKRCGTPVSTDEKDITPLDGDGERSGYSAACLKCDEDLFPFEIEQVSASEACMTDGFFGGIS